MLTYAELSLATASGTLEKFGGSREREERERTREKERERERERERDVTGETRNFSRRERKRAREVAT
jgi:hypothetical protein